MKSMILGALAALAGQAAVAQQVPVTAPDPAKNEVLIYIYRGFGYPMDAAFAVDTAKVVTLASRQCTVFKAPGGRHNLVQTWLGEDTDHSVDWKPGRTYFYEFSADWTLALPTDVSLDEVGIETASKPLQTCRGIPAGNLNKIDGATP